MTNILEAIKNIILLNDKLVSGNSKSLTRANSMGEALEEFVKDAFTDSFSLSDEEKLYEYNKHFSWLGSQNNPPDIIIRGGDAIEVKKIINPKSSLALNSSYPKSTLKNSSPMITTECRRCEDWDEKDLIYTIGHTDKKDIKSLWFVYGSIYAAKQDTYERFKSLISEGINTIPDVKFSETKELGRVNQVDPLGITNLRIRGMWQIENPRKVFSYLINPPTNSKFELIAIIPKVKFDSFGESINSLLDLKLKELSIVDKKVKDPNNPAKLIDVVMITYFN
jgi:hypothetical protein